MKRYRQLEDVPNFHSDHNKFAMSVSGWLKFLAEHISELSSRINKVESSSSFSRSIGDYIIIGDIKIANESGEFVVYKKDDDGNFTIELTRLN